MLGQLCAVERGEHLVRVGVGVRVGVRVRVRVGVRVRGRGRVGWSVERAIAPCSRGSTAAGTVSGRISSCSHR